jgi:hypothetical protein
MINFKSEGYKLGAVNLMILNLYIMYIYIYFKIISYSKYLLFLFNEAATLLPRGGFGQSLIKNSYICPMQLPAQSIELIKEIPGCILIN